MCTEANWKGKCITLSVPTDDTCVQLQAPFLYNVSAIEPAFGTVCWRYTYVQSLIQQCCASSGKFQTPSPSESLTSQAASLSPMFQEISNIQVPSFSNVLYVSEQPTPVQNLLHFLGCNEWSGRMEKLTKKQKRKLQRHLHVSLRLRHDCPVPRHRGPENG